MSVGAFLKRKPFSAVESDPLGQKKLFSTFYFKIYISGIRQYIKVGVCLTWLHENKEG